MLILILQLSIFPTKQLNETIAAIGVYFIWILFEAQLMSTWGTTPGKWLLKIKVRDSNCNKLTLKNALIRSFLVWLVGLGATFLTPVTEVISYISLQERGITMWDKYCKCNITHEKIGAERIPIIVIVMILPILIVSSLQIFL
jgi:uncharacterized RDD family membrane protein YckC